MPDRESHRAPTGPDEVTIGRVVIIGAGRVGRAFAAALTEAGVEVGGPLARGARADGAAIVLLAVPDAEIAVVAASVAPGALVGHFSGATTLEPLAAHDGFSIHPLMTITGPDTSLSDAPAAVAGASPRSLAIARTLARTVRMRPFDVADADRAAYHAAASIASNFVLTLEDFAEELARSAGVPRDALGPLVRASIDNWQRHGAASALTGPIVRGDEATVARQRAAVAERVPERLALFDALAQATRDLAASRAETGLRS